MKNAVGFEERKRRIGGEEEKRLRVICSSFRRGGSIADTTGGAATGCHFRSCIKVVERRWIHRFALATPRGVRLQRSRNVIRLVIRQPLRERELLEMRERVA